MAKYIAYCRKSTDEKERQVLSIDQQISEVKEFAERENLEISEFLTEAQTAKAPGRPIFNHLINLIEKGEINGIVSWNPDRLARNSIDGGKIIYLLDLGKLQFLKFPTHWFENTPQGRFMLSIAFGQAKYYVDNLSQNVHRGLNYKIKKGVWPARAPWGYRNDRNTKGIIVYPPEAKVIKGAFELYATGKYSLYDIGKYFYENGIKNKFSGETPNDSNLRRLLMRPFYYGYMVYNGELYKGTHEPIISKDLFDKVQEVVKLRGWYHQHKSERYNFAFTGFIKCGYCGCGITAEHRPFYFPRTHHKADYLYYHCTKKRLPCLQKGYTREEVLEKQFREIIQSISISQNWADKMLEFLEVDAQTEKQNAEQESLSLTTELGEVDQKLNRLLEAFLDTLIDNENYKQKKNELTEKKSVIENKIKRLKDNNLIWVERTKEFIFCALECAKIARAENNCHLLSQMAKKVGSKYFLKDQKIEFSLLPPFQALAASPLAASATFDSDRIFAFGQSKYYIDNLGENVKRGIRQKLRNGVYPNKAPIGYLNEPRKRSIEIDPKTARLVRKAFSLFATGKYTFVNIDKFFFEQGVKSSTNKYLRMDKIRNMLRSPFYYGIFEFAGETYQGIHKPIISKTLFDKCQEVIRRKSKTHINHKDEFWFLGLAKCKECHSAITAEKHFKFYPKTRGSVRYDYYRCGKKHGFCSQKYVSGGEFEKQIREILWRHSLHELNAKRMLNWLHADEINERQFSENKISLLKPQLSNLEQKLDRLLTGYLDQVIETSEYQKVKKKLIEEKTDFEEQISSFEKNQFAWVELFRDFINSALEAHKIARAPMKKPVKYDHIDQTRSFTRSFDFRSA